MTRSLVPALALSATRLFLPALAATTLASCVVDFDTASKTACVTDDDCLAAHVCVEGPGGRFGECVPRLAGDPVDAGLDTAADDPVADVAFACLDRDEDGAYRSDGCGGPIDCNDADPNVRPGAEELCNERDDDCDGSVDEGIDLLNNVEHCGACATQCLDDHGNVGCFDGLCLVMACDEGWWDRNGDGADGCEQACGATENACGDGRDDDCDQLDDSRDPDCEAQGDLAQRTYFMLAWETDGTPSLRIGDVRVDAGGLDAEVVRQRRTDLDESGRGAPVPDEAWEFAGIEADRLTVRTGGGQFVLHRSPDAPHEFFAGVDSGNGELLVLVETSTAVLPSVGHDWLGWIVSPLNELPSVPGGADVLGWDDPVELALLRFGPTGVDGTGAVAWPFAEYRDRVLGDPGSFDTLRPMRYAIDERGEMALELLAEDGRTIEREFRGGVTPSGDIAVGVHRFRGELCERRWVSGGICIHDPIANFAVRRAAAVSQSALVGDWTLIGVGYDLWDTTLKHDLVDVQFSVDAEGIVSGGVSGTVGVFGSSDTFLSPTSRLDLRGDPVGGGTLTLEGHVTGGGLGVFWDLSGEVRARPMHGGVYFLIRRD